ncbi:MAG: hypothetical protein ABI818_07325 [Acidobacteriota bacterium]
MRALIRKDVHVHRLGMAGTAAVLLGLPALAGLVKPDASEASGTSLIVNLNFILVLVWGDWLVSREKTKGTIGWLRTLPVPEETMVTAKVATYMLGCVSLWIASTVLYCRHFYFPARWREWVLVLCALMFFGTVSVCGRFRFRQKLGQVLPPLVLGVLAGAYYVLVRMAPAETARLTVRGMQPRFVVPEAAGILALSVAVVWVTVAWLRRAETFQLVE